MTSTSWSRVYRTLECIVVLLQVTFGMHYWNLFFCPYYSSVPTGSENTRKYFILRMSFNKFDRFLSSHILMRSRYKKGPP